MRLIIRTLILVIAVSFALTSCGGGNPIKDMEGRWVLDLNGGTDHMGVTINNDGTGSMDLSGIGYNGKNQLIMKEDIEVEVDGNDVYLHYVDYSENQPAHLYFKNGKLYSNDGQPFRKVE